MKCYLNSVLCPLCCGNGVLYTFEIYGVKKYICDECEAIFDSFDHIENIVHYRIGKEFMDLHLDLYSWDNMAKLKCDELLASGYDVEKITEK